LRISGWFNPVAIDTNAAMPGQATNTPNNNIHRATNSKKKRDIRHPTC
jgi:hypothetical protein